jgi:methyl-accepting chemotaxis protein
LGLGVFIMTALAMALVGTFVHHQTRTQYNDEHVTQARHISNAVVEEVSALMMTGGGAEVWAKVKDAATLVGKTSGVSRIVLIGNHGMVKVSTDATMQDQTLKLTENPDCRNCDSTDPADFPVTATLTDAQQHHLLRVVSLVPQKEECMTCHQAENPPRGLVLIDFDLAAAERSAREGLKGIIIIGLLSGIALTFVLIAFIDRGVIRRLGCEPDQACEYANKIAKGDLDFEIETEGKSADSVAVAMKGMIDAIKSLVADMTDLSKAAVEGKLSTRANASRHEGDFRKIVQGVNDTLDAVIGPLNVAARYVEDIAKGNLPPKITEHYAGDFNNIKINLNTCIDAVSALKVASIYVDQLARGEIPAHITETFYGDFNALKNNINTCIDSINRLVQDTDRLAHAAAGGRVQERADAAKHQGDYRKIIEGINATLETIVDPIIVVRNAADAINTAAREIAQGNSDLSQRTEQQASNLEETASTVEELAATAKHNAENAKHASAMAAKASGVAHQGGEAVSKVVLTMEEINHSAAKVVDIIGVIDSIAFQTNILALNAAVEAARAGEQGRGFAVVASEVRNLAQRSAAAAKEIKTLIGHSVEKTEDGARIVGEAGKTMEDIVRSVKQVTDIMTEIAAASLEQSSGIEQINHAISQMDDVTQQNAALVEQAAAASESLQEQAMGLVEAVARFHLDMDADTVAPSRSDAFAVAGQATSRRLLARDDQEEWNEF